MDLREWVEIPWKNNKISASIKTSDNGALTIFKYQKTSVQMNV